MQRKTKFLNVYPTQLGKNIINKKIEYLYDKFSLTPQQKKIGKNKLFFVRTYGCQANEIDGEIISGLLQSMGFKKTNDWLKADIAILNTCAIRQNAEDKVYALLKSFDSFKRNKKPNFIYGICGCMPQQEIVIKKIKQNSLKIDFVFGTYNIYELPKILFHSFMNKKQIIRVFSKKNDVIENLPRCYSNKFSALVNVMYGCNKFCSYCVVPYTRGQIRSRTREDIINEILYLKKQNYKEVVLLGQNVNSYGLDLPNNYRFANLLEDVAKTNIPRIRFATSNPWNFEPNVINVIKKYKNLMWYIHLPVQSGSERILKLMNRNMSISQYINHINLIRQQLPNCTISTDIIVGFPGETWWDFHKTLRLYKKIKFDNAYTFIFSPRSNTPAIKMHDNISFRKKQKRLQKLNKLVKKYSKWNNNKFIGKVVRVLVIGVSKTNKNALSGYSFNWKLVNFNGNAKPGDFVSVLITSSSQFSLNGNQIFNN